jgi:hypothetical protein
MSVKGPGTTSCPDCRNPVNYKAFVTVKPLPELEESEPIGDLRLSKAFGCPNCSNQIQIAYRLEILEIRHFDPAATQPLTQKHPCQPLGMNPKAKGAPYSESELLQLALCKSSGLFSVFVDVVKSQCNGHNPPANMDRYFVNFLRQMEKVRMPRQMMREFADEFGGHITYWCAQRVGMVVSDGQICRFVPKRSMGLLRGTHQSIPLNGASLERPAYSMDHLKKTSFGLVPKDSRLFMEALAHSSGDHGRTMRGVRIRQPARPKTLQ